MEIIIHKLFYFYYFLKGLLINIKRNIRKKLLITWINSKILRKFPFSPEVIRNRLSG